MGEKRQRANSHRVKTVLWFIQRLKSESNHQLMVTTLIEKTQRRQHQIHIAHSIFVLFIS